jgi:hypothetical protein
VLWREPRERHPGSGMDMTLRPLPEGVHRGVTAGAEVSERTTARVVADNDSSLGRTRGDQIELATLVLVHVGAVDDREIDALRLERLKLGDAIPATLLVPVPQLVGNQPAGRRVEIDRDQPTVDPVAGIALEGAQDHSGSEAVVRAGLNDESRPESAHKHIPGRAPTVGCRIVPVGPSGEPAAKCLSQREVILELANEPSDLRLGTLEPTRKHADQFVEVLDLVGEVRNLAVEQDVTHRDERLATKGFVPPDVHDLAAHDQQTPVNGLQTTRSR